VVIDATFDYPSQRSGLQFPAEPMLLDTCLLQHLKFAMDTAQGEWITEEAVDEILTRYPGALGTELIALGNVATVLERNGPPWVVSEISLVEFDCTPGPKGDSLRRWWLEWADYADACRVGGWYAALDMASLLLQRAPVVAEGQQSLPVEAAHWPLTPECVPTLGPFLNAGDRALIRVAQRAGIPTILTTDLKSFWRHRRALYPLGIEVWRPSDLWMTLCQEQAVEVTRWRSLARRA
jgi:hypothetical protein